MRGQMVEVSRKWMGMIIMGNLVLQGNAMVDLWVEGRWENDKIYDCSGMNNFFEIF